MDGAADVSSVAGSRAVLCVSVASGPLVPYLILVGVSGYFDWLMMRAMHLPVRSGRKGMIGSMVVVLNWRGDSGQVTWKDEIWQALTRDGKTLRTGERVVIDSVSGLTLSVKPAGSEPHEDST